MFNNKKNLSGTNTVYSDYIYENKGDLQSQIDNIQYKRPPTGHSLNPPFFP